ncbi:MAG: hypothetical protein HC914_02495, partial [Chloroflexaceae bacterium]|nr:hypothetical protein [Chloroflexaceae bacterium]
HPPSSPPPPPAPAAILDSQPIWVDGNNEAGSVALFRARFTLRAPASNVQLQIFADTRYAVWLDGAWLGRGPARFSLVRQEYDILDAPDLAAGTHVLAVLVQYDPNTRRSESIRAGLQASLVGMVGGVPSILTATSSLWRGIISPAWNQHARQVHVGLLLGNQEQLDLRALPADWTSSTFDDREWRVAQQLPTDTFSALMPRSIPLLAHQPRAPVRTIETGVLSPGQQIIDLDGQGNQTVFREFELATGEPISLTIEAPYIRTLALNGQPLDTWQPITDTRRPGISQVTGTLAAGFSTLTVPIPPEGVALALPANLSITNYVLSQGTTAGRRMLLGNPVAGATAAPVVTLADGTASIDIPALPTHPDRNNVSPRYVVLDFGRTIHARVDLVAEGERGTLVDIGWDERLLHGRPLPAPGPLHRNLWQQVDSWVLDGTARRLTTLDTRSGRYALLVVWGSGAVRLSQVRAYEETMVEQVRGSFRSGDARLDRIWQVGVDTLIPSLTDAYADPWRERGQWWGDAYAAIYVNRASVGDLTVWRRGLRQIAETQDAQGRLAPYAPRHGTSEVLMDYGLLWVEALYQYWRLTGDTELVAELLPTAEQYLAYLRTFENQHGLLDIPLDEAGLSLAALTPQPPPNLDPITLERLVLIDWSGFLSRFGESTALNAIYSAAHGWLGELSTAIGQAGNESYNRRAVQIRNAINERLYLPDRNAYATTLYNGTFFEPSPQSQAWPLVYGVVPTASRTAVTASLLDTLDPFISPEYGTPVVELYGFTWVLEALGQQGHTDAAMHLIKTHYGRLLDRGAVTWWETFGAIDRYDASLSHAWGGAPTWFLSRHVLGLQADQPGQWQVMPQPGSLSSASGQIPLPTGGTLAVAWQQSCEALTLSVTPPDQGAGTLVLPHTVDGLVRINGAIVYPPSTQTPYPAELRSEGLVVQVSGSPRYAVEVERGTPCFSTYLPSVRR